MIAFMDAIIFVVLITFVSLALIDSDIDENEYGIADASEICEMLLSTDMSSSGLIPEMGEAGYNMADAAAYATVNDIDTILDEIRVMIDELTMGNRDYCVRFSCNGHVVSIGEKSGFPDSSYSGTWHVTGGKNLNVEMWIY